MRIYGQYGSKDRLFEMFSRVNGIQPKERILSIKKNKKQNLKESLDLTEDNDYREAWDTYREYYDSELNNIIHEINDGVEHEHWNTIEFPRLRKIWEDYMKFGFVRDVHGMENIKEICIRNTARLEANTELVGHSDVHPENLVTDQGYCFKEPESENPEDIVDPNQLSLDLGNLTPPTPKKRTPYGECDTILKVTQEEFFNRLDVYIGDDTYSDYATEPLIKLAYDLIEAKTPEEELLLCDRIFNIVHARGDIAALYVQGGSHALAQLSGDPAEKQAVSERYVLINDKRRLFETFRKVNNMVLNEQILPREEKNQIIKEFVQFVNDKYEFGNKIPNITISYKENEGEKERSFGRFIPENETIRVIATNRNLADILRTLAHELVHFKQKIEGRIKPDSGKTGSDEENEANALAGVLLREFGKTNPVIYE